MTTISRPSIRSGLVSQAEPDMHDLLRNISKEAGAPGVWAYNRTKTEKPSIDIAVSNETRQKTLVAGLKAGGIPAHPAQASGMPFVVIHEQDFAKITPAAAQRTIEAIKLAETPAKPSRLAMLSARVLGGSRPGRSPN